MGGAIKKVAKKVVKPIGGLLFGKKQSDIGPDPMSHDIRRVHGKALKAQEGILKDIKGIDPSDLAKKATEREAKFLRGAAKDQRRRLQENIARKGLGRSSLALTAGSDIDRQLGERIASSQAQIPMRRLGAIQGKAGIIQPIASGTRFPVQMRAIKRGKKGGISGLLGAGIGGMVGGPQGAAAGMQIGEGLKSVF